MSFARNFAAGQQIAQTAMNAFDNARLGAILSEAENAKPETLDRFSDEDAQRIHDAAASGNEVVWDEQSGGYAIKPATPQAAPNAAPQEGGEQGVAVTPVPTAKVTPRPLTAGVPEPLPDSAAPQPVAVAQPVAAPKPAPQSTTLKPQAHTTYLDKTTVGALTPEQLGAQKADRIKGRISELFDPNMGLKRLREMQADEREDFKFGLLKTKAAQEAEAEARKKKSDEEALKAFNNSDTGKAYQAYNADLAKWMQEAQEREQAIAAGTPESELPPARPKPSTPDISPIASIRDGISVMLARMNAGDDVDFAKISQYSAAMSKLQDEGATRALKAAKAGLSTDRLAQMFNSAGQFRIDPSSIIADQMVRGEDGTSNRIIKYRDPQTGKVTTIDANAELNALGQAEKNWEALKAMAQIDFYKSRTNLSNAQTQAVANGRTTGGRAPSGGGAGGGKGDERLNQLRDILKDSKPGANFSPSAYSDSMRIGEDALRRNPDVDPATVAYAAQEYVIGNTKNIQPKLDFNTGEVVTVFTDERTGKKVKLHSSKPTPEMEPVLKGEVQAYLQQQEALGRQLTGKDGFADAMRRAAVNQKDAEAVQTVTQVTAMQALPAIEAEMMQRWEAYNAKARASKQPELPKPTQQDAMEWALRKAQSPEAQKQLRNRLELIRAYGQ